MTSGTPLAPAPVCAIVINYRRPWNMAPILAACLESGCLETICLIDHADRECRVREVPPGVVYLRRDNVGAGRRVSFAAESGHSLFLAIDDDVLLSPLQIRSLVERGLADPTRLHGIWGQMIGRTNGALRLSGGVRQVGREVHILNRVYFYSRHHARTAIAFAAAAGYPGWAEIGPTDDIFLSLCGSRRPLCHDLGPIRDCPSSNDDRIAVWRQADFEQRRLEAVRRALAAAAKIVKVSERPSPARPGMGK